MSRIIFTIISFLILGTNLFANNLHSKVDIRMELLSIVAKLAEYPEYNKGAIDVYNKRIDEYFGNFKSHPVVETLYFHHLFTNGGEYKRYMPYEPKEAVLTEPFVRAIQILYVREISIGTLMCVFRKPSNTPEFSSWNGSSVPWQRGAYSIHYHLFRGR